MKYLVTGKEMKLLDEGTSQQFFVPSEILMGQAANAFVRELLLFSNQKSRYLVVCGSGNNGGDGIAIARLLRQAGIDASIYLCNPNLSGLPKKQLKTYQAYEYPIVDSLDQFSEFDVVIDAVFGTGLSRKIEGNYSAILNRLNSLNALKVSVDIPSGIAADDGQVLGCAFKAHYTITFSFEKLGLYLFPGASYAGEVRCVPIGITLESAAERKPRAIYLEENDLFELLPKQIPNSHKGTYGKLLIVAGSVGMAGAAYLAAKAAYRTGTGLVKILTPEDNRVVLQTLIPEAIITTYGKSIEQSTVLEALNWANAVLIGPGLGTDQRAKQLLKLVTANVTVPMIMDADALNLISEETDQLLKPHLDIVVTPHIGEMSRLLNAPVSYIQTHFVETAREFADKYNVVCHLKDARSITAVPYGNSYINIAGNSGMATAGSGDVLSGIIASLMARGASYDLAAAAGAKIHADAGDFAAQTVGKTPMMASDIIDGLTKLAYLR